MGLLILAAGLSRPAVTVQCWFQRVRPPSGHLHRPVHSDPAVLLVKPSLSSNSCSSDNTVTIFENAKDSRSMFKFNSFRFQRLEKVSTVWLHCEVQVCDGDRLVCQPVSSSCHVLIYVLLLPTPQLFVFLLTSCPPPPPPGPLFSQESVSRGRAKRRDPHC